MSITRQLDRGVLLDKQGPAILTSYSYSDPQRYGSYRLTFWAKLTADAAANLTGYTVTLEARYDPTDAAGWVPVQSRNQATDGAVTTKKEHSVTVATGTTAYAMITCDEAHGAVEVRLGVKADAAGVGNDRAVLTMTVG